MILSRFVLGDGTTGTIDAQSPIVTALFRADKLYAFSCGFL